MIHITGKQALTLAFCGTGTVSFASPQEPASKQQESQAPNIIYILADDLGYGDLSCYGQTKFTTPNLDAMAAQGIKFTNHYAGCTVSAPSRCSLMTGLHTGHAPIRGNANERVDGEVFDTSLPAGYKTIAEYLKIRDYATACVGKWGMGGPNTQGHPNNHGFDYFYGHLGQGHAHFYYPKFMYENSEKIVVNTDPSQKKFYAQDLFMEKAEQFITANKDKPFFLYFSVTIPHAEILAPDADQAAFTGRYEEPKPWPAGQHYGGEHGGQPNPRAAFAAMVTRLDGDVGRLRQLLEKLGIAKNTLIIFTSDNGAHAEGGADPEFFNSTGGLRGIKRDLYEGGVRVPMIACWPQVIRPGSVTDMVSAFWDVVPTACEIAGIRKPYGLDGISFLPDLKGEARIAPDYLYWEFHERPSQAIRKGNWKAVRLNVNRTPVMELYDLSKDPYEKNNVAASHPQIVANMEALMLDAHTNDTQWKFRE